MTSTPANLQPLRPDEDEEAFRRFRETRPSAEKVTPSQQGRFLSALEKRAIKKEEKNVASEVERPATEEPAVGGDVPHIAAVRSIKSEGPLGESLTGEESEVSLISDSTKTKGSVTEVSVPLEDQVFEETEIGVSGTPARPVIQKGLLGKPVEELEAEGVVRPVKQKGLLGKPVEELETEGVVRPVIQKGLLGKPIEELEVEGGVRHVVARPVKEKVVLSEATTPTLSQQIAAAEAQAPLPVPLQPSKGKAEVAPPGRRAVGLPEQAAENTQRRFMGVMPSGKKLEEEMPSGKKLEEEMPEKAAEGMVVPKPLVTPTLIAEAGKTAGPQRTHQLAMLEVIRQSADAIATFVTKNETQTVITIRQPPIFEGATLTVTEYSSAPRQFNITFANLTPDARRLIESMANQQQLKQALVERGYTVQNVFIEAAPRPISRPFSTEVGHEERAQKKLSEGQGSAQEGAGEEFGGVL